MKTTWTIRLGLLASLILVIVLVSCGPVMSTPTPIQPTAESPEPTDIPEPTKAAATEPSDDPVVEEDAVVTASGLQYIEYVKGDGASPGVGDVVSVHYTGTLESGFVFDTSHISGEPIAFPLGKGYVIPGWDEGIAMMNVGGSAKLIIPPDLGYGEAGSGDIIPPNSTLIFEVELLEILPGAPAAPIDVAEEDYTVTDSGLMYYDIEVGDGPEIEPGSLALVHYTGWLEDGTKFDSSLDRGQPYSLLVGVGQIIPGWDEGMIGMKTGGKRQLVISPELGFGADGAGDIIPPNAILILEIEIMETTAGAPAAPTDVAEEDYTVTDSGLKYYDFEVGDGPEIEPGKRALVHYTGWLEDGTKFDSSLDRGQPYSLLVGVGQVIPGWDEGLVGMKVGGKRQLVIPPDLAYGAEGGGGVIPPNATLIFEIEIVEVP